jgi:hypothetical protein
MLKEVAEKTRMKKEKKAAEKAKAIQEFEDRTGRSRSDSQYSGSNTGKSDNKNDNKNEPKFD